MIVTTNGGLEDSLVQGGRIVYSYVTPTDFLIISESEVVPSHFFILFGGVILPPPPLIPLDMVDLTGDGLTEELIDLTTGTGGGVGAVNSVVIEIDITTDNDSAVIDIFLLEDSFSVFLPKRMAEEMTDEDIDSLSSMCIIYGGEKEVGQVNNAHLVSFCEKSPQPN
ncbi:uncharacterized protein [Onthophagus taurus]|uniref:uncharacterized protein isoform X2 n=1 Tax=Onthophagus taurus TaxID=166361 RepID=UPI0039BDF005